MKSNITLVGMPASGKSTIGVLLAKRLGYSFVDVDIVIQEKTGQLLKEIIAERGTEGFLKVEETVNAELETERSVIAPGGSVIYGPKAMEHLHEISTVVYLKLSYEDVKQRRLKRIMSLQQGISLAYNKKRIGTVTEALVEQISGDIAYGRTYAEAPEVDGTVMFSIKNKGLKPGDFTMIKLTGAGPYDMEGEEI